LSKIRPRARFSMSVLLLALSLVFLSACQKDTKKDLEDFDPDEPVTLKMMFFDINYFEQKYGLLLRAKFPNIDLKVIPFEYTSGVLTREDLVKQIDTKQPDILFLNDISQYEDFSAEGRLMELDLVIQQDQFDTSGIFAPVIDQLRESGNGKIYGLAPEFYSDALYYNADLFQKYGIQPPTDRMSWDDVLKLAQRFPAEGSDEERVYGFQPSIYGGIYDFIISVGQTMGLTPVSSDGLHLVIQSDGWRKVFESVVQAYRSDSLLVMKGSTWEEISKDRMENIVNDRFLQGQVAMKIEGFNYNSIILDSRNTVKTLQPGVVALPVDPAVPDRIADLDLPSIYAVNNQSPHRRAAWEVVKYINGEEIAKSRSQASSSLAPSRKKYANPTGELNIEPFYVLKSASKRKDNFQPYVNDFYEAFRPLVTKEIQQVADGKKSLEEAIEAIQAEGQPLLDAARIKPSA